MNKQKVAQELLKLAKELTAGPIDEDLEDLQKVVKASKDLMAKGLVGKDWAEDEDADEYRDRAIDEFKKHAGGEKVFDAMKIKGRWTVFTTELGAYRIGHKYRVNWKEIGESKNVNRGTWHVNLGM